MKSHHTQLGGSLSPHVQRPERERVFLPGWLEIHDLLAFQASLPNAGISMPDLNFQENNELSVIIFNNSS